MLSSLFDTEMPRRVVLAARGRLHWWMCVSAGPLLVMVGVSHLLPAPPARHNAMRLSIPALTQDVRVLAMGSSHVQLGLNPDRWTRPAMNLAGPMLDYRCLEAVAVSHEHRTPNIDTVIIEWDPVPLFSDTLNIYDEDLRNLYDLDPDLSKLDINWLKRAKLAYERSRYSGWLAPFGTLSFSRFRPGTEPETGEGPPEPGHRPSNRVIDPVNDGRARLRRHLELMGPAHAEANTEALIRLVRHYRQRGVRVVLVTFPHDASYYEAMPPSWQAAMARCMDALRDHYPAHELPHWDYSRWKTLTGDLLHDGDHLNSRGAVIFTAEIEARLRGRQPERGAAEASRLVAAPD